MFPSVWLSVIFASSLLEGINGPLFCTCSRAHACIHTAPPPLLFFFSIITLFNASSFLLCQFGLFVATAHCCALWWSHYELTGASQGCFRLSIDIDRACHLLYLYFLYSRTRPPFMNLSVSLLFKSSLRVIISLSTLSTFSALMLFSFLFFFFWQYSPGEFLCAQATHGGQQEPFPKVNTAYAAQYYRFIHIYIML